jgi:hypothetical protein
MNCLGFQAAANTAVAPPAAPLHVFGPRTPEVSQSALRSADRTNPSPPPSDPPSPARRDRTPLIQSQALWGQSSSEKVANANPPATSGQQ